MFWTELINHPTNLVNVLNKLVHIEMGLSGQHGGLHVRTDYTNPTHATHIYLHMDTKTAQARAFNEMHADK